MPYARSLPFTDFLQKHTYTPSGATEPVSYTTVASPSALHAALENALGKDYADAVRAGERGVITSCGSGMTAGVLWLGLQLMGVQRVGLYDEVSPVWPAVGTRSLTPALSHGRATPLERAVRLRKANEHPPRQLEPGHYHSHCTPALSPVGHVCAMNPP